MTEPMCEQCGHPFAPHLLEGVDDAELGVPVGGTITCPVEGCFCWATWDVDPRTLAAMRRAYTARLMQGPASDNGPPQVRKSTLGAFKSAWGPGIHPPTNQ